MTSFLLASERERKDEPRTRLRILMRPAVEEWEATAREPTPPDMLELLDKLQ